MISTERMTVFKSPFHKPFIFQYCILNENDIIDFFSVHFHIFLFVADMRSESGLTSPFTPRSGSGTPSLPDEGEFPCPQCEKRFGNRRNLMSHMRRHTGQQTRLSPLVLLIS
jgi:hypothetical protein